MEYFSAALVREKMTIEGEPPDTAHAVLRSNRIFLKLGRKSAAERIAVRAQNMHLTMRIAGRVLYSYQRNGSFLERGTPYDWAAMWEAVQSPFDRQFAAPAWCAVYINGRSFFSTQESPFTDVVEQCALLSPDDYDSSIAVAQSALKEAGRRVVISHAASLAATVTDEDGKTRCGLMNREGGRSTTFLFTAEEGDDDGRVVHVLEAGASFLEAINLHHIVLGLQKGGLKTPSARREERLRAAGSRLASIGVGIKGFENMHRVHYRPERPVFLPE